MSRPISQPAQPAQPAQPGQDVPDVPDELVTATTRATSLHFDSCDWGTSWRDCPKCRRMHDHVRSILTAALPQIRKDERAKVAAELYERAMRLPEGSSFRRHLIAAHQIANPPTVEDAARAVQALYEDETARGER